MTMITSSGVLRLLPLSALLSFPGVATCFILPPSSSLAQQQPSSTFCDNNNYDPQYSSATSTSLPQSSSSSSATSTGMMKFFQHEVTITAPSRGCHLITSDIQKTISKDLSQIKIGMCNLFVQHTSASLTINENADPDVRRDMEGTQASMVWMESLSF